MWWILLLLPRLTDGKVYVTQSPTNVKVSVGGSVRLPCRAQSDFSDNMTVYWNRDGFGMSLRTMKTIGKGRYHVRGPLDKGVFDLEISPVNLDDEGVFQCQVAMPTRSIVELSNEARLEVLAPPKPLILIQTQPSRHRNRVDMENPAWAELGSQLRLLCIAEGGKPAPEVIWSLDSQQLEVSELGRLKSGYRGRIVSSSDKDDGLGVKVHSTKSSLFLRMTPKVQNKRIRCGVKNVYPSVFVKPVYAKIQVRMRPKVKIYIEGPSSMSILKEHDTITIRCAADGFPKTFIWRWSITSGGIAKDIPEVSKPFYQFQLRRELNEATIRCTATNFASGFAEVKMNIQYGPAIRDSASVTHAAILGESTQLRCDVDSNPQSTISWIRDSYPSEIGRGAVLTLPSVDSSDLGPYTCVAQVAGFPPARKSFFLGLAGKPKIESRNPVFGTNGKSAKLVCSIFAIPKPPRHSIRWTKRGQSLIRDDRHHIYQRDFLEGVRSVIFISHIEDLDYGEYNCSASNTLGSSWAVIALKKKEELPLALVIGLGAAGFLIIASFLIIIIFFVRRSRQKKSRKQGYLPGESRPSDGPPSVYGVTPGSTSNDFSNKEASWLRGEARHSYFHVPSELGEMHGPGPHPLSLDASREATLRRIMEWRDDGSPIHPASTNASTNRGSPMHSSTHQATHHQYISDRGSAPPTEKQQPSNSDSGISNDNFYSPNPGILPPLARNHSPMSPMSPMTYNSPNIPISPVRSQGSSNHSTTLIPSPPLLFSGPRRTYQPASLGDSSDDTRI